MHKELLRTAKYILVTASAGILQFGSFALFSEVFHWGYWVAYLIALLLSVVWNFTINRRYTFKSTENVPKAMLLVALFYFIFTPASTYLEHFLTEVCLWNAYLVTILNMLLNFALEFPYQRFVIYRRSVDTNDIAQKEKAQQ